MKRLTAEQAYKLYLKRAKKDKSDKITMDKQTFKMFWNASKVARSGLIDYIKETENLTD